MVIFKSMLAAVMMLFATHASAFDVTDMEAFKVVKEQPCLNEDQTVQWLNARGMQAVRNVPNLKPEYGMFVDNITRNTAILFAKANPLTGEFDQFCLFAYGIVQSPPIMGR